MDANDIKRRKLPDSPGVYFFLGSRGKVLYIGRATSLRDRMRSYFSRDIAEARGHGIAKMISEVRSIKTVPTDSVLESILLEANLIKKHQPPYNSHEKDDKSFNYLGITKEDFPRVLVVRGRDLEKQFPKRDVKYLFGPFPAGLLFREALKFIRKIFPYRDTCLPATVLPGGKIEAGKPCFNRQIGLCPGVCSGEITKREYARTMSHIKLLFEGKKRTLLRSLSQAMKMHAKAQEFEKAHEIKRQLFALTHIQDIALIKRDGEVRSATFRVEAYDIAHLGGAGTTGVMVVVEDGEAKRSEYRKFRIRTPARGGDTIALKEVLSRRLGHPEWPLPRLVVVDGGVAQRNAARAVLRAYGYDIAIVGVVKDEHHRPREILGDHAFRHRFEREILLANSEAHRFALAFHRRLRRKNL